MVFADSLATIWSQDICNHQDGVGVSELSQHILHLVCGKCLSLPWWRHQMETFSALLGFVRGIHRSPVNSLHKGQWRGALMFSLICVWINVWVNNGVAGDLTRYRPHYDVIVMQTQYLACTYMYRISYSNHKNQEYFLENILRCVVENVIGDTSKSSELIACINREKDPAWLPMTSPSHSFNTISNPSKNYGILLKAMASIPLRAA